MPRDPDHEKKRTADLIREAHELRENANKLIQQSEALHKMLDKLSRDVDDTQKKKASSRKQLF